MERIKLGIQLYSLRNQLRKPEQVRPVFERLSKMGAEVVQVSAICPMDSRELARISEDTNLPICITHVPVERIRNDLDRLAEEHLDFNCRNMGIGMMPDEFRSGKMDDLKRFVSLLNETAEKLSQYGMTIAYHNHDFEFKELQGRRIMDVLIQETRPEVMFIPDSCWIHAGGFRTEDYLEKMSGRIDTLHLKDYRRILFTHTPMAIGDGILDFKSIMESAVKHGVKNAVIELDFSPFPMGAMRKGLKRIRNIY